ncbi:MAG: DUF2961 domain-containing protein [Verrucomicrobia bacterium]|nr:MAG: DUF2961 domain-containing protein [Verrucomicrobiota bacterium]
MKTKLIFIGAFAASVLATTAMGAGMMGDSIAKRPDPDIQTRWYSPENPTGEKGKGGMSNFGRKGYPCVVVAPGETLVMADIKGNGTIRRIWSTTDPFNEPEMIRGYKFEIFWDGVDKPAVQVPMSDFYGHVFGKMTAFESAFFSCPEARSYNCVIPMPFKTGAKVQVTNESPKPMRIFYEINVTLGENNDEDTLYFHSVWRRVNYTKAREDFEILPKTEGEGRFLGCNIGMRQNPAMKSFWFGEGEYKVYLDGDEEWPTLNGTGTEDFIGSGWGQGKFNNLYQGCPYISEAGDGLFKEFYGFYRFHVPDPIFFHKDIRVVIQVMGGAMTSQLLDDMRANPDQEYMKASNGKQYYTQKQIEDMGAGFVLVEREDDMCATAYWYMDSPVNTLPELAPVAERIVDLPKE